MTKKKSIKKRYIVILVAYVFLFVSSFSLVSLAKYVSSFDTETEAIIAKWDVSLDTDSNESDTLDLTIGSDNNPSYNLKITSVSEIKTSYSIVISDLPTGAKVKLDERDYVPSENGVVTFDNVGYINADANDENKTKSHNLKFNLPIGTETIDGDEVNIDVIFNQTNPSNN